jgi:hypothetical protein
MSSLKIPAAICEGQEAYIEPKCVHSCFKIHLISIVKIVDAQKTAVPLPPFLP